MVCPELSWLKMLQEAMAAEGSSEWRSSRNQRVSWTYADVEEMALRVYSCMPEPATEMILRGQWTGGPVIMLTDPRGIQVSSLLLPVALGVWRALPGFSELCLFLNCSRTD
eukprot:10963524-Alexandrium_andersonii.AAC.1